MKFLKEYLYISLPSLSLFSVFFFSPLVRISKNKTWKIPGSENFKISGILLMKKKHFFTQQNLDNNQHKQFFKKFCIHFNFPPFFNFFYFG